MDKKNTIHWLPMTERFLATRLSSVRDEQFELGVSEDILLREPLRQQHVVRLPLHRFRLPLPDHPLLQTAKGVHCDGKQIVSQMTLQYCKSPVFDLFFSMHIK